ncbi:hypothetical protein SISNIDRAFT_414571 [Sistotremastrum niveocremeum HHB9708]|uniref:TAFII55 protein conserved region domain-containing protein n=1 Tax=Sistotremastrum niveocremeum HHB9708 TaxID=1314777 RepID=A0A164S402_9AGAM|nr:hypothetical protein SISNIDRAFT_414571 [Sistotremastrum niveocremeum HHB9708]
MDERTTRSSIHRSSKSAKPKLKLKLSEKAASQAPVSSFLGNYDRELDSDDEELAFEEQFILRLPPGDDLERLRKMVAAREISNDVWFKFKDSRRGVFHIGNSTYSSKLVDLPCIIESQKHFDGKHMFKVADISQMLVVEEKIQGDEASHVSKGFNIDDFIWPHGITPPLHHVRKRRFRKRLNRRTIETVEQEVERLLREDEMATTTKYEVLENVNPDLSDSEFIDRDDLPGDEAVTPFRADSELGDAPTPMAGNEGADGEGGAEGGEDDEDDSEEGDIDEELAAELDVALDSQEEDSDDDEEDEEEDEEEDDDDDDDENVQARRLLNEEIRDLEAAVTKKATEIERSHNPLIKRRFEESLKKLRADLDLKLAQRDQLAETVRRDKENAMGITSAADGEEEEDEADPEADDQAQANEDDTLAAEIDASLAVGAAPPIHPVPGSGHSRQKSNVSVIAMPPGLIPAPHATKEEEMEEDDLFGGDGDDVDMH